MTAFNPIITADTITDAYGRYLSSSFSPRREEIARAYSEALNVTATTQQLSRLILEPKRRYASGARVTDLCQEGTLDPVFEQLVLAGALHPDLYHHQERAVRAAVLDVQNIVVATGTGSGKTEAFLLPILNGLVREHAAGLLTTNVKAILLYPMNALANDQMKRIREVFRVLPPDITFGRYIGATEYRQSDAEKDWSERNGRENHRPPNELISREVMDAAPPHLLLTNYAMLERLLLLPRAKSLFSPDLQWLVLDEVHSYDGARGTEMAFLLRRLRQRTVGVRGRIQCFAASATLGSGKSSAPQVARYASELFDEPFDATGVITPTHVPIDVPGDTPALEAAALAKLDGGTPINADDPAWMALKTHLRADPTALPVRYHQIVSSPAGAFVCLHPRHPDTPSTSRITLRPGRSCVWCSKESIQSRLFELSACRKCGAEYLRGREQSGRFELTLPSDESPGYALLGVTRTPLDPPDIGMWSPGEDSAEKDDSQGEPEVDHSPKSICVRCLAVSDATSECRCGSTDMVDVFVAKGSHGLHVERCLNCGYAGTGFGPIARAVAGVDALSAVLASSLYATLPRDADDTSPGGGRKLLTFSDSRQDAAYFAPFLKVENEKLLRRGIIREALDILTDDPQMVAPWESEIVVSAIAGVLSDRGIARGNTATQTARTWLRAELMPRDTRQSLEGVGLLRCSLSSESLAGPTAVLRDFGIKEPETLVRMLIDTMRLDGAVGLGGTVDASDPVFSPLVVEHFYVLEGAIRANLPYHRWLSANAVAKNRRTRLVRKALDRSGVAGGVGEVEILRSVWTALLDAQVLTGRDGRFNIPLASWSYDSPSEGRFFCSTCRRWTWLGGSVCPTPSCLGTPLPAQQPEDYWSNIYRSPQLVQPMEVKEHTAQWSSDEAQKVQEEFISGTVNVLSGSTTFEMGVDVGAVQAVFCRNVPPTPANYIQRAGRAGRRAGDTSLAVTLARTRSHDTYYAAQPERLVAGVVPVPTIDINNVDLARRHLYATALSTFLTETSPDLPSGLSCGYFFEPPAEEPGLPSPADSFATWLRGPGRDAVPSADIGFPKDVETALGISTSHQWIHDLIAPLDDDSGPGPLTIADQIYTENIEIVRERRAEVDQRISDASSDPGRQRRLNSLRTVLFGTEDTLQKRDAIGELANNRVLPKYGFPVDVVALYPIFNSRTEGIDVEKLNLTRDLRLALREYAPGNEVMAAGKIIRSVGLKTLAGYNLLTYEYVTCDECDWFVHRLKPDVADAPRLPEHCGSCGGPAMSRTFVEPRYGFVGEIVKEVGGSRRPVNRVKTRTYLSYEASTSDEASAALVMLSPLVSYRGGGEAKRLTLTTSQQPLCLTCGYVDTQNTSRARSNGHPNLRSQNPDENTCDRTLYALRMGHEHKTEILEVRLALTSPVCVCGDAECDGPWRSVSAALAVGASRLLKVSADDIDSDITGGREPRLMLFDTATGGAGYTRRITSQVPELLRSALDVARGCVCSPDGSCYQCLRNYQNQTHHEHLSRAVAEALLSQAIASL